MNLLIEVNLFKLTGNVWINLADIVYIRPQQFGRSYVVLRTGQGFEDEREVTALLDAIATKGTVGD